MKAHMSIGLFTLALLGQTPPAREPADPLALLPKDPLLVIQVDGPAALRRHFAGTRLAELLGSEELAAMVEPFLAQGRKEAADRLFKRGLDFTAIKEGILGYGGRITFALGMSLEREMQVIGIGGGGGRMNPPLVSPFSMEPRIWVACLLSPDGEKTDLEKACRDFNQLLEETGAAAPEILEVEGRSFRTTGSKKEMNAIWPAMIEGHLAFYAGTKLEGVLASALDPAREGAPDWQGRLAGRGIRVLVRGGTGVSLLKELVQGFTKGFQSDEKLVKKIDRLFTISGLECLDDILLTVSPVEKHVRMKIALRMKPGERGFLDCLSAPGREPELLPFLPFDQGNCSADFFDIHQFYSVLRKCVELFSEKMEMSVTELEDEFEKMFKIRLQEDLLQALGKEFITFQMTGRDAPRESAEPLLGGAPFPEEMKRLCLGMAVRDRVQLTRAIGKLLRSRGLHVSLRRKEYRGMDLYTFRPLGMPIHYAVTDRLFLVSFGPAGGDTIRTVLDRAADREAGKPGPSPAEAAEGRLALLPKGWTGLTISNMAESLESIGQGLKANPAFGRDPDLGKVTAILDELAKLIRKKGLTKIVTVTYADQDQLTTESIW